MPQPERIAMTPDEIDAFLRAKQWLVLGVLDADGFPTAAVAPYHYAEGVLFFPLDQATTAFQQLMVNPRVCAIIEQSPSYYEIKAVTVHGTARLVSDPARRRAVLVALDRPDDPGTAVLELVVGGVVSFDFSKIQRKV